MKLICLSCLFFLTITTNVFSQKEGYWDKDRTTSKQIELSARNRLVIKSEDLPVGTTELVYRITTLDENQQLTANLASVLKAIPDPTGISQGTAGALLLLSKITGENKCKFAIFSSNAEANEYLKSGKTTNACWFQNTPVNKDAKLLSLNSKCFKNTKNIWFGFESDNWIMNEKVILEIVPWVDYKLSRGWNPETKKEILTFCSNLPITNALSKKEVFCGCFIESVTLNYTYKEYSDLLTAEKAQMIETYSEKCLQKDGNTKANTINIRNKAKLLFESNKKQEAIEILQTEVFEKGLATVIDYKTLGRYYLLSKQFEKAEKILNQGIAIDESDLDLKLNLAHVYMFTNQLSKSKTLHKQYQNQNISATISWIQQTKTDFVLFEKEGFDTENFKKITRILE